MVDKYIVSLSGVPEIKEGATITRLLPGYEVVTIEDHDTAIKAKDEEIARLREACILALSIFVNQEAIDKFPVLYQELKTVLSQHEREESTHDNAE